MMPMQEEAEVSSSDGHIVVAGATQKCIQIATPVREGGFADRIAVVGDGPEALHHGLLITRAALPLDLLSVRHATPPWLWSDHSAIKLQTAAPAYPHDWAELRGKPMLGASPVFCPRDRSFLDTGLLIPECDSESLDRLKDLSNARPRPARAAHPSRPRDWHAAG